MDSKNRHVRAGARGGLAQSVRTPPEHSVNEHTECQTDGSAHSATITRKVSLGGEEPFVYSGCYETDLGTGT